MDKKLKFSIKVNDRDEYRSTLLWVKANCSLEVTAGLINADPWYPFIHYTPNSYSVSNVEPISFVEYRKFRDSFMHSEPTSNTLLECREYLKNLVKIIRKENIKNTKLEEASGLGRGCIASLISGKHDPRFSTVVEALKGINKLKGTSYTLSDL